jgi:NAD(P)-dependent dehydrogenase (short-subunit alcohol dehydrogenase family)
LTFRVELAIHSSALEYAKRGIRLNAVGRGAIATPMIDEFITLNRSDRSVMEPIVAAHPLGQMGTPEEIAEAVLWLCSSAASFVLGASLSRSGAAIRRTRPPRDISARRPSCG